MYILFDIGGTKMRIATSNGRSVGRVRTVTTPASFKAGMVLFRNIVNRIRGRKKIKAIVGGIAGSLNKQKSQVIGAPNLSGWQKKPLKRTLARMFNAVVHLENDAALAGLGETCFGAGRGCGIVAYYTISTGVGGARIVNNKIDVHTFGFEPGYQVIGVIKTSSNGSIMPIYLEPHISGSGLAVRFQKDPEHINDKKVWQEVARWLAFGLNNSIVHWSPEIIILGGALINNGVINLQEVRQNLKATVKIFSKIPSIKKSELGDVAGLYGALAYLQQKKV